MRDETWIEELAGELTARGVPPEERAAIIVEVESHLHGAGTGAFEAFGAPATYADAVADATGPVRRHTPARTERRVTIEGVTKAYGGRPVLHEVTLEAHTGDIVALIGPNGAGKSTLLRIVAGFETADAGTVRVDGRLGYAPQHGGLAPHLRPVEHLELFGAAHGLGRRDARREGARLARELDWDLLDAPVVGELSGGTRQKLTVVLAMLGHTGVLLLDEPYQGMDLPSTQRFWELLADWGERGGTALVVAHNRDVLVRATRVVELSQEGR